MRRIINNIKKIINYLRKYSRQISQTILVCFCILTIIFFMPREKNNQLEFKKGTPWKHEQLIADFDFDITKPENMVQAERDTIAKNTQPIFRYDATVADSSCHKLDEYLSGKRTSSIGKNRIKDFKEFLKELYGAGVVSDNDAELIRNGRFRYISYNSDSSQMRKRSSELLSCSEAGKRLTAMSDSLLAENEIVSIIKPNYLYDENGTRLKIDEKQKGIDTNFTKLQKGQRIISYGDLINDAKHHIIDSYLKEREKRASERSSAYRTKTLIGQILFVIIALFLIYFYLELYQPEVVHNAYKFVFSMLTASVFPIIVGIMSSLGHTNVFILPFAIVPMMLCLFVSNQAAFVIHTITILICSTMLNDQYEFVLLQTATGYSVILSLKELSSRMQMFRCTLIAFATYSTVYLCYSLITSKTVIEMHYPMYMHFAISSMLTLIAYPMMVVFEKMFHFISNVTLIELSNFNSPLLQKLSQEAPGTFQHSIQVSNLAAEAASAIGGNSLLARTGALYHDIGKLKNPVYFTENQSGGVSPHTSLSYIESAQIIIKHVTDGLELAKREGLPKRIQEFIMTHHGLSKTGWFYISYKNEHPDEEVDESLFTYPGPKPTTKEQAVLMLADCTEAASHSIKEYSEENINKKVDDVIDGIVRNRELELSPLTFQDIDTIKRLFKKRLMAIYHTRISYPKEIKKEDTANVADDNDASNAQQTKEEQTTDAK